MGRLPVVLLAIASQALPSCASTDPTDLKAPDAKKCDEEGCLVVGPHDTTLTIPSGALRVPRNIRIKETVGANTPGVQVLSSVYTLSPIGEVLSVESTVTIPLALPPGSSTADVSVYASETLDGQWRPLPGFATATVAVGRLSVLTHVLAGSTF